MFVRVHVQGSPRIAMYELVSVSEAINFYDYIRVRSPKNVSVFKSKSEVNIFHQFESMFESILELMS